MDSSLNNNSRSIQRAKKEYNNIRENEAFNKTYYNRSDGLAAPPHTICLSVNSNCFMKCKMCDIGTANSRQNNSFDSNFFSFKYAKTEKYKETSLCHLKAIIDEVAPSNPIIKTNFVEPLLYGNLRELAEYIKRKKLKYYTITNGWTLKKHAHWLAEFCDLVRVSLDGIEEVHDTIRGKKGAYSHAMEGLKELIQEKHRKGSETPIVGVCYTISNYNYFNLYGFMEALDRENLLDDIYINFNHLLYTTQWEIDETIKCSTLFTELKCSSLDKVALKKINIDKLKREIEKLYVRFPKERYHYYFSPWLELDDIQPYYDPDIHMFAGTPCYLPWYAAQLDMDGNVNIYGHCILPNFGNAFKDGFFNAWNSPFARQSRLSLKSVGSFPGCNKCIGTLYPLRGRE